MTEDRTFFPRVGALITGWLPAVPRLYKCQSKVHLSCRLDFLQKNGKKKKQPYILLIVRQQNIEIQHFGSPPSLIAVSFFVFLLMTSHVCHHYSCSLSRFLDASRRRHFDI